MESCVSQQHYVTPGATSLPMSEYVQMPPDMGPHPCNPAMTSYLESLPPGVGMPEYPWMKEKKTVRKPPQQGESLSHATKNSEALFLGRLSQTACRSQSNSSISPSLLPSLGLSLSRSLSPSLSL